MKDSSYLPFFYWVIVVNCFQKLLSSWWRTADQIDATYPGGLWIAFKNYYLRDEGQLICLAVFNKSGCELLSKIIIFVMKDSLLAPREPSYYVVNCFQKLLSSWWRTAFWNVINVDDLLWIAFKNYYLRDEGQLQRIKWVSTSCCELLSKIIIFVMKDSQFYTHSLACIVVNCFQKLLSSWWRTAKKWNFSTSKWLWIAFKNYYLRDEGQLFIICQ